MVHLRRGYFASAPERLNLVPLLLGAASAGTLVGAALFILGADVFATTGLARTSATLRCGFIRLGGSGIGERRKGKRAHDS